ncbi:hypothetical protein B0H34DRAFT_502697 [Crassisporium funariophilum]|nr:hypothetical protein B0H34DRAFT_502697 [Crassisporium funariophilum]
MVHVPIAFIITALLVAPSIAIPVSLDQNRRTLSEDIEARNLPLIVKQPVVKQIVSVKPPTSLTVKPATTVKHPTDVKKPHHHHHHHHHHQSQHKLPSAESQHKKTLTTVASAPLGKLRTREDTPEMIERDTSSGPPWIKGFKNTKKAASPVSNMPSVSQQKEAPKVVERDMADFDFEELAARDPSFGSWFRKIKKAALPAVKLASLAIRQEAPKVIERDLADFDFEALAARDPSFGSLVKKIKKAGHNVSPWGSLGKYGKVPGLVTRDENPEVYERGFEAYEIDELD